MSIVLADRVQETTTTTGTGTIHLAGAAIQCQTFVSGVGNGNQTYYCLVSGDSTNWEVGIGTVTVGSPNTLSRTTILASSNSGSAISLFGTSTVFGDAPAALLSILANGTTGTGAVVLASSPTITSPTLAGTATGAGTIPNSVLQNSSITVAGHAVSLGGSQTLAASDLTNGTTGSGNIVLAASPTLSGTVGGSLIWSGNQSFKTETPWVDVKAWGATGNGITDDTAAIQAAISYVEGLSFSGAILYFPPGVYLVSSTLNFSTANTGVTIRGAGRGVSVIQAANNNITVLELGSGLWFPKVEDIGIYGTGINDGGNPATVPTQNTVVVNCNQSIFRDVSISDGAVGLYIASGIQDCLFDNLSISNTYGSALHQTYGSDWYVRCKFDNVPEFPTGGGSAWAASTSYSVGNIASVSGFWLICTVAGTSGSAAPTPMTYGTNITDGTVTWQLYCPVNQFATLVTTGAGENHFVHCDFSGQYISGGFGVSDGDNTAIIFLTDCALGTGYIISGGKSTNINHCELGGVIDLTAGTRAIISNNAATTGAAVSITVWPGVSNFIIEGNDLAGGTITVDSGASDHYNIVNNINCTVSDNGTGAHKTISGNN